MVDHWVQQPYWPKGKKRLEYTYIPEIIIDDRVNNGDTKLNMLSICVEQSRSLISKNQSLTFEMEYTQKLHLYAISGHKPSCNDFFFFFIKCQSNSEVKPRVGGGDHNF